MSKDLIQGKCAKQTVTATVIADTGERFTSTNYCLNPQNKCPRSEMPTGVGYELCKSICKQVGHAEVNAIRLAGSSTIGATLYIEGHTYACESCERAAFDAGIQTISFRKPIA